MLPPLGDLLAIDDELHLDGLAGPVDAVRDINGRMHIYATSVTDAMLVQGYLVARDRHVQLEFLRRAAVGRLAEMLGAVSPGLHETDIGFRHIGLHRTAAVIYEQAPSGDRALLDAFAAGVSQLYAELRTGERELPQGIAAIKPEIFGEWTAVDSLAVGRLQTWLLSYSGDGDISNQALLDDLRLGFDAADSDPAVAQRAGIERDFMRFASSHPATTISGISAIGGTSTAGRSGQLDAGSRAEPSGGMGMSRPPRIDPPLRKLIDDSRRVHRALDRVRDVLARKGYFGSNNWAVGPELSATGNALLASDPHLGLGAPAIFWPVSIHVEHADEDDASDDLNVAGIAFPGIPGIILGHNEHVAWGATVAMHDVTDVYRETLTADGTAVMFNGEAVALETITEEIDTGTGDIVTYDVQVVPHHGPIFPTIVDGQVVAPDPATGALSVRWTGLGPTGEFSAVMGLLRARSVDEARAALDDFGTGAQNWMLADVNGDIAWTTHALVPYRSAGALSWDPATYQGQLPCFVLPGDGSAEWTGYWPDDQVPWAKNPPPGYIATANNDPVGGTVDNDPSDDSQADGSSAYLNCGYAAGHRQGRIQALIDDRDEPLTLDDMSAIQGDHRSPLGARLTEGLLLAIDATSQELAVPGSHPDLANIVADPSYDSALFAQVRGLLESWRDESDYAAASGVNPDDNIALPLELPEARAAQATTIFNAWLVRFAARVFGDEMAHVQRSGGDSRYHAALWHLMTAEPATLATYDASTGDSALFDDIGTPQVETRQERIARALLDALSWLAQNRGPIESWRWGALHTVTFEPAAPTFATLAMPHPKDEVFTDGFPRHGDMFVVDASNYRMHRAVDDELQFAFGSGPTQRFVIEMDPAGLKARNALPGGAVFDADSAHHGDQAEEWRRNQVHDVPYQLDAVIAAAETRTVVRPLD